MDFSICADCGDAARLWPLVIGGIVFAVGLTVALRAKRRFGWLICVAGFVVMWQAQW